MAEYDKGKLSSGRYFLCLCAGACLLMLAFAVTRVILSTIGADDPQVHPVVLSALTAVISLISGALGFYFGQNVKKEP